jgi:hypothetical protein
MFFSMAMVLTMISLLVAKHWQIMGGLYQPYAMYVYIRVLSGI